MLLCVILLLLVTGCSSLSISIKNLAHVSGVFLQVLETRSSNDEDDCEGSHQVTSVGWAPAGPSVGQLAAASGKNIYLYSPTKLARAATTCPSFSGVYLVWSKCLRDQIHDHRTKLSFQASVMEDLNAGNFSALE